MIHSARKAYAPAEPTKLPSRIAVTLTTKMPQVSAGDGSPCGLGTGQRLAAQIDEGGHTHAAGTARGKAVGLVKYRLRRSKGRSIQR